MVVKVAIDRILQWPIMGTPSKGDNNMSFNLTELETKAAITLVQACLDGMGGSRPSDLEYDEYTWVEPSDLTEGMNISKNQAAGLFSSLHDKGFIFRNGDQFDMFGNRQASWVVATEGWRYIDTIWDQHLP